MLLSISTFFSSLVMTGGVMFWIVMIAAFICMTWSLALDEPRWTTFTIALFIAILYFCGSKTLVENTATWIYNNPGRTTFNVVIYTVIGVLWSFYKWYLYMVAYKKSRSGYTFVTPPKAAENKGTIISWMSYWPVSVFWYVINDPVKKFFNFVYERTGKVYDRITDRVFKDMNNKTENKS